MSPNTIFGAEKSILFILLSYMAVLSSPFPTSFLPLQGDADQEAKGWLQLERNHIPSCIPWALQPLPWALSSYRGDQRSSAVFPQACVLSTYVNKKGRRPAEAELKSSSPSWLLMTTSRKRDGYCSYCYYCYKWASGGCCVDNILLTHCKQRRKFIADPCMLANINKNVKSSLKKK